ncbi:MAG: hybrid sensor histidine kinase/response regulator [Candidatus Parabeggiatoa sp. nov. 3]|nr:MAG: hybrid sensor histidine kinase/response regulator [Gammaproteobacteria bacterium]RKZ89179.1 MAG: hybrid sensor histidine kinase/response regulator [Gammaproteobacteria bacterium]HEW97427.1 response regulator [Beggiatoa sp.]
MNNQNCLLIVDDDPFVRDTLQTLLAPEGYQIAFAKNGLQALQISDELMPDLILLDVMMPVMDGFETCERLRANPKLAEVPIIMLTALDDRDSRLRGIEAGADDFLTKPVNRVELRTRIRAILRLNRYRRLLTERSRFEWAIEQLDDGFLLLNDGNVIRYINSAARSYLDISKDDSEIAEGFLQQVNKHYQREPAIAWENWPSGNITHLPRYLVRPETNEDPPLWLQVNVLEFTSDQVREQLVHLRDVTEKILLQRQMWSFHVMVSHKLRTPLNALTVLPVLTQKDMVLSPEEAQSLLQIVQTSTDRLQKQLIEVLQYVDTTSLLKLNTRFSLSAFPSLLTTVQNELEIKTVTLFIDEAIQEKTLAFSQEGVELVLRELLSNAKKFHPDHAPQVEISIKPVDAQKISLSVSDNGQHLPTEALKKVWAPYFQNEKFVSGEMQGMGLGLSMVAKLIWGSGGTCHFENRDDQTGIRVELILPLKDGD